MSSMHPATDVQHTLGPVSSGPKPVSGRRNERLLRCAAAAHRSRELATGLNFSGLPGRGSRSSRWGVASLLCMVSPEIIMSQLACLCMTVLRSSVVQDR